jgi:predicted chitinase
MKSLGGSTVMNNAQMLSVPLGKPLVTEDELVQADDYLYEQRLNALAWMKRQGIERLADPLPKEPAHG